MKTSFAKTPNEKRKKKHHRHCRPTGLPEVTMYITHTRIVPWDR